MAIALLTMLASACSAPADDTAADDTAADDTAPDETNQPEARSTATPTPAESTATPTLVTTSPSPTTTTGAPTHAGGWSTLTLGPLATDTAGREAAFGLAVVDAQMVVVGATLPLQAPTATAWTSADGTTWTAIELPGPPAVARRAVPTDQGLVVTGLTPDGDPVAWAGPSVDALQEATFAPDPPSGDISDLAVIPGAIVMASDDGEVYRSTDGGATWTAVDGLGLRTDPHLVIADGDAVHLLHPGDEDGLRLLTSTDGAQTFTDTVVPSDHEDDLVLTDAEVSHDGTLVVTAVAVTSDDLDTVVLTRTASDTPFAAADLTDVPGATGPGDQVPRRVASTPDGLVVVGAASIGAPGVAGALTAAPDGTGWTAVHPSPRTDDDAPDGEEAVDVAALPDGTLLVLATAIDPAEPALRILRVDPATATAAPLPTPEPTFGLPGEPTPDEAPGTAATPDVEVLMWTALGLGWDAAPDTVPAGEYFLTLESGDLPHTLVFEGPDAEAAGLDRVLLRVEDDDVDGVIVDLPPGTYTYFCDIAGHRAAGEEGTLVVTG